MKHCSVIILTLAINVMAIHVSYAKTIVISTLDGSMTPIAEKVMFDAYKRIDMTLKIIQLPTERALQLANKGEVDGELYRKNDINKAYPNLIVIPVPIVSIDEMVFTKDKKFKIKGWESLRPYKVGYRKGIKIIEDNLNIGIKNEGVQTLEQLFMKLDNGRTDVVIETRLSGLQTIAKLKLKDIIMLEPPIAKAPLFHCLNIKNKHLVKPLTAVLKKMEKDGTIYAIQKKAERELLNTLLKK